MAVSSNFEIKVPMYHELTLSEYDKLPQQHLKDFHYTEAAVNLNKADNAHQSSGGSMDDEPAPLALGKGGSRCPLAEFFLSLPVSNSASSSW